MVSVPLPPRRAPYSNVIRIPFNFPGVAGTAQCGHVDYVFSPSHFKGNLVCNKTNRQLLVATGFSLTVAAVGGALALPFCNACEQFLAIIHPWTPIACRMTGHRTTRGVPLLQLGEWVKADRTNLSMKGAKLHRENPATELFRQFTRASRRLLVPADFHKIDTDTSALTRLQPRPAYPAEEPASNTVLIMLRLHSRISQ